MLIDKMREVQLVADSKALKIDPVRKVLSRFDKTVYVEEPIISTIEVAGTESVYVEAAKFFSLYGVTKKICVQEDSCLLSLDNGGEYKLQFLSTLLVGWEDRVFDFSKATATVAVKLAAGRLSSATLKNLANPMLQCIYVDDATAVSCNAMVACIDGTVTSPQVPLVLPPDVVGFVEGAETLIHVIGDNYAMKIGEAVVFVPIPKLDYAPTADVLRNALPIDVARYPVLGLLESLKRLSSFGDYVTFQTDRVVCGDDFEPFLFPCADAKYQYNIQNLISVLGYVKHLAQAEYALIGYGESFLFMVSPEPVTESV